MRALNNIRITVLAHTMGNLGILKAGAEFSVLDPAYPNDQQCMYLDVAQLKGLISIAKALQEDGGISGKVHSWINQHLH